MFERDIYHVLNRLEHSQANVYLVFLGRGCKYIFSRCLNCWCSFYFEGFLARVLLAFLSDCSNDCQQSQGYFNIS